MTAKLEVKDQGIGILTSLIPNTHTVLVGKVNEATVAFDGSPYAFMSIENAPDSLKTIPTRLSGVIDIDAERSRVRRLQLKSANLKARVVLSGDTVTFEKFSASTQSTHRRFPTKLSLPLTIRDPCQ